MKPHYHPVPLHVIRGQLEFVGCRVTRIRCTKHATEQQPYAIYDVTLARIGEVEPWELNPWEIREIVNQAFVQDVNVLRVRYDGENYVVTLVARVGPDNHTVVRTGDSISDPSAHAEELPF